MRHSTLRKLEVTVRSKVGLQLQKTIDYGQRTDGSVLEYARLLEKLGRELEHRAWKEGWRPKR